MALNHIFPKWYYSDQFTEEHKDRFNSVFADIVNDTNYHQNISNHLGEFVKIDTTHHDIAKMFPWNKEVIGSYVKDASKSIGIAEDADVNVVAFRSYIGLYNTNSYRSNYSNINPFSNITVVYFHKLDSIDADKFKFFEDKSAENATGLSETFSNESIVSDIVTPEITEGTVLVFPSTMSYLIQKCQSAEVNSNLIFTAQVQVVPQFISNGEYFMRNENPMIFDPKGEKVKVEYKTKRTGTMKAWDGDGNEMK